MFCLFVGECLCVGGGHCGSLVGIFKMYTRGKKVTGQLRNWICRRFVIAVTAL